MKKHKKRKVAKTHKVTLVLVQGVRPDPFTVLVAIATLIRFYVWSASSRPTGIPSDLIAEILRASSV